MLKLASIRNNKVCVGLKIFQSIFARVLLPTIRRSFVLSIAILVAIQSLALIADETSESILKKAQNFLEEHDFQSAINILELLSQQGDAKAINELSKIYYY